MLEILFFPFSHVSKKQAEAVLAFFPYFRYFPLSSKQDTPQEDLAEWIEKKKIFPEYNSLEAMSLIESQVHIFKKWAELNRGNERNLKALFREYPYFSGENNLTQITSELRSRVSKKQKESQKIDNTLLFLKFAKFLDQENQVINYQLRTLEKGRRNIFRQLQGLDTNNEKENQHDKLDILSNLDTNILSSDFIDPGRLMTGKRVISWMKAANQSGVFERTENPIILVTSSPAVFDFILSYEKDLINGLDIESIKLHENDDSLKQSWQSGFCKWVQELLTNRKYLAMPLADKQGDSFVTGRIKLLILTQNSWLLERADITIPNNGMALCLVGLKS